MADQTAKTNTVEEDIEGLDDNEDAVWKDLSNRHAINPKREPYSFRCSAKDQAGQLHHGSGLSKRFYLAGRQTEQTH